MRPFVSCVGAKCQRLLSSFLSLLSRITSRTPHEMIDAVYVFSLSLFYYLFTFLNSETKTNCLKDLLLFVCLDTFVWPLPTN